MLHWLETFCTVAQLGSFSRAAAALHISQPAVTRQIKALEKELGALLLTRTAQGVTLTPVGEQVLIHARRAVAAVAACRRAAAGPEPGGYGPLRLAVGAMQMQFTVPPVLAAFRAEHPDLQVELHTGHHLECLERLAAYEVDLALIATPQIPPGLKAVPLYKDPVVLAAAPGSAYSRLPAVSLADLAGRRILVLPRQSGFRKQVDQAFADRDLAFEPVEYGTVEMIKTMAGLAVAPALLPRSAVVEDAARGHLVPVPVRDWPDDGRTILAVTRTEGAVPEVVRRFVAALRDRYEQGGGGH